MQDSIVMLESGEIPSPLDQAMIGIALRSVPWNHRDEVTIISKAFLNEVRYMLYEDGNMFVTSTIGKYNITFVKETKNE